MKPVQAIKKFFERQDTFAPDGGRKVKLPELRTVTGEDRKDLAQMAAAELGVELA